jgi:hypothetical protein
LGNFSRKFKHSKEIFSRCGTQTAALAFGGGPPSTGATEEYDGSTWTSNPTGLNTARHALAGCGIQTAGLAFGGLIDPPQYRSNRRIRWFYLDFKSYWFKYSKTRFSRLWNSNSSISIWRC